MKMPGFAPLVPACHDPSVLITLPAGLSSAVASPKYQTLPWRSWVYQSVVRSASFPASNRLSLTVTQGTPRIVFVRLVTR